jgi:hypothetical protein
MLCKIWGFHGGDYEACRLLGYKVPVRDSHTLRLRYRVKPVIPCKIWGFHGCDYEECRLLGCNVLRVLLQPTFQRHVSPPSSGWKESAS